MRQLATLPSADTARTLADYLLTLKIDTRVERESEGWAVWICDEDHLPRARQELEEFARNPSDPRYEGAGSTAAMLRKQKLQEEKAYHRRQERFYARMGRAGAAGGVTLTLMAICVVVLILKDGFTFGASVTQALSIAPYKYVLVSYDPFARTAEEAYRWELRSPGLQPILHGEIWRLVTPIFLHFRIWHIVFNLSCLYTLGGAIEWRRGRARYLTMVLALAVLSNLAQYFLGRIGSGEALASLPRAPNFGGMSGVVYGLFGYIWMKERFQPELGLRIGRTNIFIMMGWFFLCMTPLFHILIGSGVANVAHAAGLLGGMLIGYIPTLGRSSSP